jgi:probable phosphoglycerate mutase
MPPVGGAPPAFFAGWLARVPEAERAAGAALARAAVERFAVPAESVTHELIVTHSFMVAWFVVQALGAPDERWLGQNHCNGAVTAIRYLPGRPPALMVVNDQTHLPPALRWTGFPPDLAVP